MTDHTYQPGEEDFVVRNNKEILQILNALKDENIAIKVSFNHGEEDYLTSIIQIDAGGKWVYLDVTIDDDFNKRLLASAELLLHKDDGIRIKWKAHHHKMVRLKDGNAIRVELPSELMRLQRRELFRLKPPITAPIPCVIPLLGSINPKLTENIQYYLADVSLGGVSLMIQEELAPALEIGAVLQGCKIDFPKMGQAMIDLQIKNITRLNTPELNGDKSEQSYRVGFEFKNTTRSSENLIYQYTFNLERSLLVSNKSKV